MTSVPHFIKLLAASIHETLGLDVPYELQYVARTQPDKTNCTPYPDQRDKSCPLAHRPEKRSAFYKVAPNKTKQQERTKLYPQLIDACKAIRTCAKYGRDRTPKNQHKHNGCSTSNKTCPKEKTALCQNGSCNHPNHVTKSIWRSDEFTIQAKPLTSPELVRVHSFLFREGELSAISSSLLHDLYSNYNCNLCTDFTTP
ncbi:hypothetical protein LOD99_10148 [Oopsacas minuta]|uniref:Uncharacterized protein n=1 Tax=Oopsacas minuta TaxID=111878 RepID=A0AAV7KJ25_9METZ|nr:hypothetical protein LOD99_10148 [Oopsacas minuta]